MLKSIISATVGLFVMLNTAWGQVPHAVINVPAGTETNQSVHAVINAPTEVEVGQSVWLKTNESVGEKFIWKILPENAEKWFTELPIYGGLERLPGPDGVLGNEDDVYRPIVYYWAHFETTEPSLYHFVFVAISDNEGDVATHTVRVGEPKPPPPPPTPPDPNPTLDIPEPTDSYKQLVVDMPNCLKGPLILKDSYSLAKFYKDMGDVVSIDTELETTADIRELNIVAGKEAFSGTGIKDRYDPLDVLIDKVLEHAIGLQVVSLNVEKRNQAVKAFYAIAWKCYQVCKNNLPK